MTQNPENVRRCPMPNCGRILKPREIKCPVCFPIQLLTKRDPEELKAEPWYCADCKHKFGSEFQECPVCRTKTHVFCDDCGMLHLKNKPCPICNDESDFPPIEGDDILEVPEFPGTSKLDAEAEQDPLISGEPETHIMHEEGFKQQIREKMIISKEEKAKLEAEQQQTEPETPQNGRGGARPNAGRPRKDAGKSIPSETHHTGKKPDGRKQPWTDERRKRNGELRRKGLIGRPHSQTQTVKKKETLQKLHASKKADGRKHNRPANRPPPKSEEKPEPPVSNDEKICPLTNDLCKEQRCGWWNANLKACAILILSMDQKRIISKEPI